LAQIGNHRLGEGIGKVAGMKFRIRSEDGQTVEWDQDGPLASQAVGALAKTGARSSPHIPLDNVTVFLSDTDAQELWLELAYQLMRVRHPERNLPE
jgi:hypothetical protein